MSGSSNFLLLNHGRSTPTPSQPNISHATAGPTHTTAPPSLVLAKDEALQKAIQEYIGKISNDDKEAFRNAPDIIERLQEMQSSKKPRIPSSFTTRVENILQCVRCFMSSLAIFIQQNPEISSLIVGGVNCILTLVLGYIEFFERLTRMMERMGTHLSYLTEYSKTSFQGSEKLQKALVGAYCDLLEFYIRARKIFSNKKGGPSYVQGFKLFFKLTWEPFEAQFGFIEARFLDNTLAIVRLAFVDYQNQSLENQNRSLENQQREREIRKLEQEKEANKMRRNILRWLSPDDFETTYETHFKKRFKNTGQWLLDDPRFINWRDGAQSSLLWCYGTPGTGKTILASLVIEHLSALCELSAGSGITFVYCNYKESRTITTYISIALKQLCRTMQYLPPGLQEAYNKHYKNDSQPKYEELRDIFLAIIQQLGCVFFVVDALDECTLDERKKLCEFLLSITDIASSSQGTVKFFITSRKESDIERAFQQKAIPTIEIEATKVDSDIKAYVQAQIKLRLQNGSLSIRNMELKNKILRALTTKAGGMFLWVEFQLDAICAELSDNGIEKALDRVPEDMNATYERILNAINEKPQAHRKLARRVLIWTAYAQEPLPIEALAAAISIEKDTKNLEDLESTIPTEKNIFNTCANLISVDRGPSRYVQFVHFSIQEFLTSHQSKYIETLNMGPEAAHREIAQSCIILLTLFPKQRDRLGLYALHAWPHHLLAGNLNSLRLGDQIITLTTSFLDTHPMVFTYKQILFSKVYLKFSPLVLALIFDLPDVQGHRQPHRKQLKGGQSKAINDFEIEYMILSDDKLAMHYAVAELDSVPIAQRLYQYGYMVDYSYSAYGNGDIPIWLQRTALYSVQSIQMARFLLDNDTNIKPQYLSTTLPDILEYFIGKGNLGVQVIRLLFEKLGDIDQNEEVFGRATLQLAVSYDNLEATRLLLDKGANVNTQGGKYDSALQAASRMGNIKVVRLLLDKGADVNTLGGKYGSALQAASWEGSVEVVQLLLDKGANVNTLGGDFNSALQAASQRGNIKVVRLLLDKGADVNIQGGEYGSALEAALYKGNVKVVRLLLDKGADVNTYGGEYGNALQAASYWGNAEVIRLLLDKGAEVNTQSGKYGSALQAALYRGNVEVVQLLLDKGAEFNTQGGEYGSALQIALYSGNVQVVWLLLDKGADVNTQGGEYGNALQAASYRSSIEVVWLLLDKGADVNTQGGKYGNALQAASYRGYIEVVQLLLGKGADVNTQGGKYGNALQAASYRGNIEVVQLLLDKGADVNTQGGEYGNALQAASYRGDIVVVLLLLGNGADVNTQGGEYGNALQAASYRGNIKVVRLLLDKGADVGTALQAALAPGFTHNWKPKELTDIFPIVELLLDYGAESATYISDSEYGNALTAAIQPWKDSWIFDAFIKLLISRGWDGGRGVESDKTGTWSHEAETWSNEAEAGSDETETWSNEAETWSNEADARIYEVESEEETWSIAVDARIDKAATWSNEADAGSDEAEIWSDSDVGQSDEAEIWSDSDVGQSGEAEGA